MKDNTKLFFCVITFFIFTSCTTTSLNHLQKKVGFYVKDTVLYDSNNVPFVMRGVNHMHTWYPNETELALKAIRETGCNTVRIVLSNGIQWQKNDKKSLKKIIDLCKANNLVCVLEVHDTTGTKDEDSLLLAAEYFIEMKDILIGQEDYVIINVANEWPVSSTQISLHVWKNGYAKIIPMLRNEGLAHTIMVDCAGGGQNVECIELFGKDILNSDPLKNVIFSAHLYGKAGGTPEIIKKNISFATDSNLCICVGEFGYKHTDGDIDEEFIVEYCQKEGIGYLAWCWKGNAPPVEYLDIAQSWDGSRLSPDWGYKLINGVNGIRATSKPCSVF